VVTLTASAGKVLTSWQQDKVYFRDAIVASSAEVGNLENFSLTFLSIVAVVGNAKVLLFIEYK
jgi:hypothetical protein